jgi:hypothetical protein
MGESADKCSRTVVNTALNCDFMFVKYGRDTQYDNKARFDGQRFEKLGY